MDKLIGISRAAEMLGVSAATLRNWDNEGKLKAVKTISNHRRYLLSEIEKLQSIKEKE